MANFDIHEMLKKANELIENESDNREVLSWFSSFFGNLPKVQLDSINRFGKYMPEKNGDDVSIILKGHILIEEQVKIIFNSHFNNPKAIKKQKFEISQIISIVEATFVEDDKTKYIWSSIRKLNKIRNDIAHNLENKGLTDKINDFIKETNKIYKTKDLLNNHTDISGAIIRVGAYIVSLATRTLENRTQENSLNNFKQLYSNNYVGFDNKLQEILNDKNIDLTKQFNETEQFKKCFNDTYYKLIHLVDVTNNEYIACTYGLVMHLSEIKSNLSHEDLIKATKELQKEHSKILESMNSHFKDKYDFIVEKSISCLKDTIKNYIDTEIVYI